ncbi:hypothetical protein HKCCE3408_09470 [Rhodobacterales bacterium HKCCE3408]|nr:hypothetical protein [Rhodobacterales bacterium HKCCE3408]
MRTMDPALVRASFNAQVTETIAFYRSTRSLLTSDGDISKLSALTMVALATTWESFLSDLFVAYINRDPSQFVTHLEYALLAGLTDKQKEIQSRYAKFNRPGSVDRATINALLDPNGNNITFPNTSELKVGATRWLSVANGAGVAAITDQQGAIIDLWIALRNHIAHDSERSREALKRAVSRGVLHGTGLHRATNAIHTPGVYLKSMHQPGGNPRLEVIAGHMSAIGNAL